MKKTDPKIKADEWLLVELFRSSEFESEGRQGDYDNLRPCQTAVRLLKAMKGELKRLRAARAADFDAAKFRMMARHTRVVAEALLTESFGERCPEFNSHCEGCKRWAALDTLLDDPWKEKP